MKAFANLYTALDTTTRTNEKTAAMTDYFASVSPEEAAWAIYFLSGRKPRQIIPSRKLVEWAIQETGIPDWLFSESYDAVGDMAETITLLLPESESSSDLALNVWVEARLLPLRSADEATQREAVVKAWHELNVRERFVWNKLITGAFRVGVSQRLVTRALAQVSGIEQAVIEHRLMGIWEPTAPFYNDLVAQETTDADISRPYPFFLAYPIETDLEKELGDLSQWQVEWKWDGIRAQAIQRQGEVFLWSRGEELVTDRYPEVAEAVARLPEGTVIDGELLPWSEEGVMPFAQLQRRIGRKTLTKKMMSEVPVILLAYDLLEDGGRDVRAEPLSWRRARLTELVGQAAHPNLLLSQVVEAESWEALQRIREESRDRKVEGMMLKRRDSAYGVGRTRGDWWKWKIEPYTVDAVLIYAQRGSGKRASLYTDYTFAVWDNADANGESDGDRHLIPFAKAYSGLTDAEIREVDSFIRRNTQEKFGPVRTVKPELVFELAFEGIQRSSRHKSGIAVRFPRILRWRKDKPIEEADSLATIEAMLPEE
ncbi:MAG: ATP-dependent DNA ligase [bacterium]|nr:ATP-dependent DNA ligase [bacterium]